MLCEMSEFLAVGIFHAESDGVFQAEFSIRISDAKGTPNVRNAWNDSRVEHATQDLPDSAGLCF